MELHQIRYFLAAAEALNFTRAAERCHVTQSALTKAIQRLEDELGGPLIHRERRLMQLTALGRLVQPHLAQTFAAAELAKRDAIRFRRSEAAVLRIGIACSISAAAIAPSLRELLVSVPRVDIRITEAAQDALVDELLRGDIDAAVIAGEDGLSGRLGRWPLLAETYRIAFAPGHRLGGRQAVTLADLDGETVLTWHGCGIVDRLAKLCAGAGIKLGIRHSGATEDHIAQMAFHGLGIAVLPNRPTIPSVLPSRPLSEPALTRSVVLAAVNGRRYSPTLDAFLKLQRRGRRGAAPPAAEAPAAGIAASRQAI
jgi:LysR family hydrogen peroxide-inducible transcriptional activator